MSATTMEQEFQSYGDFMVEFLPKSHRYFILKDEQRIPAISVTSALSILDKPALRKWYGNMDATAVLSLERDGQLTGIPTDQAIYVARQRGYGAEARRDAGAARGTAVHEALRTYCETGHPPLLGGFNDETKGYVQAACNWLVDASPEPVIVERILGSPMYGFAGRMDLIALIDGKRVGVDFKTGANAHKYPEAHIQLAGYQLAFPECDIEPLDLSVIVSLDESGLYQVAEQQAGPDDFLAVLNAHRAVKSVEKALRASEKG